MHSLRHQERAASTRALVGLCFGAFHGHGRDRAILPLRFRRTAGGRSTPPASGELCGSSSERRVRARSVRLERSSVSAGVSRRRRELHAVLAGAAENATGQCCLALRGVCCSVSVPERSLCRLCERRSTFSRIGANSAEIARLWPTLNPQLGPFSAKLWPTRANVCRCPLKSGQFRPKSAKLGRHRPNSRRPNWSRNRQNLGHNSPASAKLCLQFSLSGQSMLRQLWLGSG